MTKATTPLYLGVDIGSSSSKAALVDADGVTVATASIRHEMSIPRPGWAEQDADDVWWHDFVYLCRELLGETDYSGGDVAGVGVSAIGPCVLPLDGAGKPLRPGILYGVDTRASAQISQIEEEGWRPRDPRHVGDGTVEPGGHAEDDVVGSARAGTVGQDRDGHDRQQLRDLPTHW